MPQGRDQVGGGLAELVGALADGLGKLVTEHIELARLELSEDARAWGGEVGLLLAFAPFVLVGYTFLCAAGAAALSRWIGWAGSLLLVGGVNVAVGGVGIAQAVRQLKRRQVMTRTVEEFKQSASILGSVAEPVALEVSRGR